jgi:tricorn protease-like protein
MCRRTSIYFVSDRDGVMNLHRYDLASESDPPAHESTAITTSSGRVLRAMVRIASCMKTADLYLFDTTKETSTPLSIRVNSDLPAVRVTTINAQKWLQTIALSLPARVR